MRSVSFPGEELPRLLRWIVDELKRLRRYNSALAERVAALEAGGGGGGGGGATGPAGGVLSGTYPNPGFAVDMATQAELNAAVFASGLTYTHEQSTPSDTWIIVHNKGVRFGGITVEDSAGNDQSGEVIYVSDNEIHLLFNSAFAGTAYLS